MELVTRKFFHVYVNSPLSTGTSGNFNPNLKLLGDTACSICIIQNMQCLNKIHIAIVKDSNSLHSASNKQRGNKLMSVT